MSERASTGRPCGLLRGQVGGRAQHGGGLGQGFGARGPGDAEVHDLHLALRGDHDVPGLDVAVDDPRGVGEGQGRGHLRGDLRGPLGHEVALGLQHVGERLPATYSMTM